MAKAYHQLTYEQRCQIDVSKSSAMLQKDIAAQIGVSPATISRELARNRSKDHYDGVKAHSIATSRRRLASSVPLKLILKWFQDAGIRQC